jgi:thioesterase domain-containing protein
VPGAFGFVMYLHPLAARLGVGRACFGLRPPDDDGARPWRSVPELAAHLVERLRRHQPEGPYHLVGHSFGGAVVFEMAHQLRRQGLEPGLVALLDAGGPGVVRGQDAGPGDELAGLLELVAGAEEATGMDLGLNEDRLRAQPGPEATRELVLATLKRHQLFFTPDAGQDALAAVVRGYRQAMAAHRHYRLPGRLDRPLLLVRAADESGFDHAEADLGWGEATTASIEIVSVPGNHETMMVEPHVGALADLLRTRLHGGDPLPARRGGQ